MSFAIRLKQIIKNNYNSQVELAIDLDVSKVAISEYINSKRKPNYDMLEKFYNLGYSIDWLISGKGSMKRTFVNEDDLDNYDRVVFDHFSSVSNTPNKILDVEGFENKSANLSIRLKLFIYQEFSYKSLKRLLLNSVGFKELDNCFLKSESYLIIVEKLQQFIGHIINGISVPEEDKLTVRVEPHVDISRFRELFSRFIYLMVEIEIFKKFIEESDEIFFKKNGEIYDVLKYKEEDLKLLTMEIKRDFSQLKSNFKVLVDQINDVSYTDSKVIIFSGIVNNIFKIEQS